MQKALGDVGENGPEHWEKPLGSTDVHLVITALAPDSRRLESVLQPARKTYEGLAGVSAIWRQDCHALPDEKEPFGFKDGISHPAIEGSGTPGSNSNEDPLKAGEFVLGYRRGDAVQHQRLQFLPASNLLNRNQVRLFRS